MWLMHRRLGVYWHSDAQGGGKQHHRTLPSAQGLYATLLLRQVACSACQLYVMRIPALLQAMAQDEVHLEGHLLVCGCGTPPAALACLLKPLRSTTMRAQQRSIVVLDTTTPEGPEWEELSR